MENILDVLIRHGTLALFAIVFVEQVGLPLPAPPFLLAAGALAGKTQIDGVAALSAATLGAILADSIWFSLGRVRGNRVLELLCRISIEPDSCVRRTEDIFVRHGMRGIVTAKFLPGLGTLMAPLAGIFQVPYRRFLLFDGVGSLLYVGGFMALGLWFSDQLQELINALERLGFRAGMLLAAFLAGYIAFRMLKRQLTLRELRMARITPEELRQKQEAGQDVFVVDLRSVAAVESDPFLIPGARHLHVDKVESWHQEIPRDREVVLYCSCPNEAAAAKTALILQRRGVAHIRPLLGGIDAWREHNYPVLRISQTQTETINKEI
jgi:membrane protein DedA with SNARE-associated domain/rhodanese-related sulfurtransferase